MVQTQLGVQDSRPFSCLSGLISCGVAVAGWDSSALGTSHGVRTRIVSWHRVSSLWETHFYRELRLQMFIKCSIWHSSPHQLTAQRTGWRKVSSYSYVLQPYSRSHNSPQVLFFVFFLNTHKWSKYSVEAGTEKSYIYRPSKNKHKINDIIPNTLISWHHALLFHSTKLAEASDH